MTVIKINLQLEMGVKKEQERTYGKYQRSIKVDRDSSSLNDRHLESSLDKSRKEHLKESIRPQM